jgi:hypothetical protein
MKNVYRVPAMEIFGSLEQLSVDSGLLLHDSELLPPFRGYFVLIRGYSCMIRGYSVRFGATSA